MTQLSKQDIVTRVRLFTETVRNNTAGFLPERFWWLVTKRKSSTQKYSNAVLLLQQLGIDEGDMKEHFTAYWATRIGDVYRFLERRMAWHLGIGDEFFKKKAINDNCPQEMYDSLAIIAGGAGGANM